MTRMLLACSTLSLLYVAPGCNSLTTTRPQCYSVRGRVLLANGQPLPGGRVEFYPKGDQGGEPVASGEIGKDGDFVIGTYATDDGTNPGDYIVTIQPISYKSGNPTQAVPANLIPTVYLEPETSPLVVAIKPQANHLEPFRLR